MWALQTKEEDLAVAREELREMLDLMEEESKCEIQDVARCFVELFNHSKVQENIRSKLDLINNKIMDVCHMADTVVEESQTAYDVVRGIRSIVDHINCMEESGSPYDILCNSDMLGLLRSERFRFLIDDSKTTQALVDDLNRIIDEHWSKESTMSDDEFESYARQWKDNRKMWVPEKKLKEQEDQMRAEFLKKKAEYRDLLSSDITQLFPSNTANEANMGEIQRFLKDYFEHKRTDEELHGFITDENSGK